MAHQELPSSIWTPSLHCLFGECYGLNYVPQNSYVGSSSPRYLNVNVFADPVFKETIKVK